MVPHIPHVPRVLAAAIGVGALLIFSAPVRAQDGALRGVVVDSAGDPVAGADLILDDGARSTRSGEDGSFRLVGLPPREGLVEVRAQHPAHPQWSSEPFEFARLGSEVEVEIVLEHGGTERFAEVEVETSLDQFLVPLEEE